MTQAERVFVEDWCDRYSKAKNDTELAKLRRELEKTALNREQLVIFSATFYDHFDEEVIKVLLGKKPLDPIDWQDIEGVMQDDESWIHVRNKLSDYRERRRQQK